MLPTSPLSKKILKTEAIFLFWNLEHFLRFQQITA